MKETELRKIANDFVKGFGKVERMCYFLSAALEGYLSSAFGIKAKLVNGVVNIGNNWHGHYWLELENGKILDATAGQFYNPISLKVFLGKLPENYYITEIGKDSPPSLGTRVASLEEIAKFLAVKS